MRDIFEFTKYPIVCPETPVIFQSISSIQQFHTIAYPYVTYLGSREMNPSPGREALIRTRATLRNDIYCIIYIGLSPLSVQRAKAW
jgi:hypothetical protein